MKRIDLRVVVPLLAVLAVIALATVAISTASRSEPSERLAPANSREAKAVVTTAVVPLGSDKQSASLQETEATGVEAPTAEPTEDTSGFVVPIHEFCTGQGEGIHRVSTYRLANETTVRNRSPNSAYIVVVTVEGEGTARCYGKPLSIYTPLELRTEQVLVNKTGSPVMTVLEEGGVVGKDSVEIEHQTELTPGKRYILFAGPMPDRDGSIDPGTVALWTAMPVNEQGQVLEGEPGELRAVPLTEALQIIQSVGGSDVP